VGRAGEPEAGARSSPRCRPRRSARNCVGRFRFVVRAAALFRDRRLQHAREGLGPAGVLQELHATSPSGVPEKKKTSYAARDLLVPGLARIAPRLLGPASSIRYAREPITPLQTAWQDGRVREIHRTRRLRFVRPRFRVHCFARPARPADIKPPPPPPEKRRAHLLRAPLTGYECTLLKYEDGNDVTLAHRAVGTLERRDREAARTSEWDLSKGKKWQTEPHRRGKANQREFESEKRHSTFPRSQSANTNRCSQIR